MGHGLMGQCFGSHGSWVGACWPMTQYSINPVNKYCQLQGSWCQCLNLTTLPLPMLEKLKVGQFGWFQGAPDGTDVTSASARLASTELLNNRVLNEIRKYETVLSLSHIVTAGFDPLHWWGQHEESYPSLSDCARRFLVTPASSAECERQFGALNARHLPHSVTCSFPKLWRACG